MWCFRWSFRLRSFGRSFCRCFGFYWIICIVNRDFRTLFQIILNARKLTDSGNITVGNTAVFFALCGILYTQFVQFLQISIQRFSFPIRQVNVSWTFADFDFYRFAGIEISAFFVFLPNDNTSFILVTINFFYLESNPILILFCLIFIIFPNQHRHNAVRIGIRIGFRLRRIFCSCNCRNFCSGIAAVIRTQISTNKQHHCNQQNDQQQNTNNQRQSHAVSDALCFRVCGILFLIALFAVVLLAIISRVIIIIRIIIRIFLWLFCIILLRNITSILRCIVRSITEISVYIGNVIVFRRVNRWCLLVLEYRCILLLKMVISRIIK